MMTTYDCSRWSSEGVGWMAITSRKHLFSTKEQAVSKETISLGDSLIDTSSADSTIKNIFK